MNKWRTVADELPDPGCQVLGWWWDNEESGSGRAWEWLDTSGEALSTNGEFDMSVQFERDKLIAALSDFRDAGLSAAMLAEYIERFILAKVDEIVKSRGAEFGKGAGE